MIDLATEEMLTLPQAAKELPGREGRRGINVSTVWRWCKRGVQNGVRLESVVVGRTRFTSRQALQRFIEKSTAVADGLVTPQATPAIARRAHEAAERELAADGI